MARPKPTARKGAPAAERAEAVSPWEWAVAAAGAGFVALVIGYMAVVALTVEDTPPAIEIRVEAVTPAGPGHLVSFSARNAGGRAAAEVQVEGALARDGRTAETGQAVLDYLPAFSERRGGLYFTRDPAGYELTIRATGFREP